MLPHPPAWEVGPRSNCRGWKHAPRRISRRAVAALAGAQPAAASDVRYVTFAARWCPTYAAINANEARNNIQESLQPLGANTPYGPNAAMDPVIEETHQPLCQPLAGWKFTLGTGYQSRAVPGPWGNLSKVTGAYANAPPASPNPVTTLASTDLLNSSGAKTGTIAGAVTLQLSADQVSRASNPNSLWVMGGTPTDPVATPANYAFGALRCGVDNLNGDNVEWVTFPNPAIHVFCFAYYVKPPPPAGTIIVRKRLSVPDDAPDVPSQAFRFTGNLSFTPHPSNPTDPQSNYFDVTGGVSDKEVVDGQVIFPRAAGSTWTFPRVAAGVVIGDLRRRAVHVLKQQQHGDEEPSQRARGVRAARRRRRGHLHVHQQPDIRPRGSTSARSPLAASARSGSPRVPEVHRGADDRDHQRRDPVAAVRIPAQAGQHFTITETPPDRSDGHWATDSVSCGGEVVQSRPVETTIPTGGTQVCTFTNGFVPKGSITLNKVTLGATATTSFPHLARLRHARHVRAERHDHQGGRVSVRATGDDTSALPLGTYLIREMTPSPGPVPGELAPFGRRLQRDPGGDGRWRCLGDADAREAEARLHGDQRVRPGSRAAAVADTSVGAADPDAAPRPADRRRPRHGRIRSLGRSGWSRSGRRRGD